MSKFIKLDTIKFSTEHYGNPSNSHERKHLDAIKAAKFHYVKIDTIDEIVPGGTVKKTIDGVSTNVPTSYLVVHYEGGIMDHGATGPRDRDSYYQVEGTPESWIEKIAAIVEPAPEPEAETETETETESEAFPFNDRGAWQALTEYAPWDIAHNPDNESKRYLCINSQPGTNQGTVLLDKSYWCPLPAVADESESE